MDLPPRPAASAWGPLRHRIFRMLWLAWLTANVCMWMNELAAAWLMSTLSNDPVLVALVRTAATLPAFLLALPSGAMADIVDRRRWFIATQLWVTVVATLLAAAVWAGIIGPTVLLVFVLAYGAGLALRWPVYSAIVPELVPKEDLARAVALNGLAANAARTIGPMVAGALMAWLGTGWVFALNAVLSLASAAVIGQWRPAPRTSTLPVERFFGAMRVGLRYAAQSPPLRAVLWHSFAFSLQTTALLALLPLVAKSLGGGETTYTLLMASMSIGAVGAAMVLPRWRSRIRPRSMVHACATVYAASAMTTAYVANTPIALVAMIPSGAAWMAVSNVLATSAQFALQDWVRARGMSMYLMTIMGGSAAGAALWGIVARYTDVPITLAISSVVGLALLWAIRHQHFSDNPTDEMKPLDPAAEWATYSTSTAQVGPVMVTIEYLIDPGDSSEFAELMQHSRRARLRGGALSWGLLQMVDDPCRYVEYFVDENWVEQTRRHQRLTKGDAQLRTRRRSLHRGTVPPRVTRYVMQTTRG
ncbi:MFS transporter [Azohydromonas australica]|uniref:MFS transporter n=1 Tax=Azohydromonas australica TaxID=364039 RepID=UPI0003F5FA29|nr:MFS transporter [Azohydromonas australica]